MAANSKPRIFVARSRYGWLVTSLLALSLFTFSWAFSVSPVLHHWLHEDSHSPQHHCLATWLPEGKAHPSVSFVAPPAPALGMAIVHLPACPFHFSSQPVQYPGRGPPQL
jgi:hypothetical protein